jgi:hypothetical protein
MPPTAVRCNALLYAAAGFDRSSSRTFAVAQMRKFIGVKAERGDEISSHFLDAQNTVPQSVNHSELEESIAYLL